MVGENHFFFQKGGHYDKLGTAVKDLFSTRLA